ncbi:hypothetical protein XH99_01680 [Bradyrhizobium nanningense]|uniref:Uncharacterized protein n=1 Tax=Bradyrhizobium nanningense TaxID=1325118 RepID=A0A4Q0SF71_9BRAD|nr:hypothetical protein [Bradyrhizobium nanningense]RXH38005.1 hypothetical protein XH99_01680 [Bradyrhizobium nanningense]
MIIASLLGSPNVSIANAVQKIFAKQNELLDEFWRADVSLIVWKQPAAGDKLSRRRQSATGVAEALFGRARSEKIVSPSKSLVAVIRLTSVNCLLSIPQFGCPEHIQGVLVRKGRLTAEINLSTRPEAARYEGL